MKRQEVVMYEQVFNLTSRPFTSIHYVKHYFPAEAIDQTLRQTKMLVERGSGPVVIVGDHGTGKTLLLAILEEGFKSQFRVVNISASLLRSREDLLQNILFQLQMNCRGLCENDMRLDLAEMLKSDQASSILLLIDDAQKLTIDSVEEMHLLNNFIHEGQPRVRLVLAGSQGVEERLADTRLTSFTQRIAGRFFLGNLNSSEVEQYVRTHIERAGGQPDELFTPDSFRAIHEVSEGCPRYINQVCDHAMIFAATRGAVPITDSLVREAWYDIQKLPGCVAPSGSGAAISEEPVSVQSFETDSEGWTVLEFGQLSDADAESEETDTETAEAPTEPEVESDADVGLVDAIPAESADAEQSEQEPEQQPEPSAGQSFTADPSEETPTTESPWDEVAEPAGVSEPTGVDAPSALGGAAILASAMAGFGIVASAESEAAPTDESVYGAQTPLSVEALGESEASSVAESSEPQSVESEPVELPEAPAEIQSSLDQPIEDPQQEQQPETSSASTVFEDPFADDNYENEEVLVDAYSPFVAQQNQRSLEVTSEQLQNLTPGETVQWNESPEPQSEPAPAEEERFPTFETAMEPPEPVRESQMPLPEPRAAVDTRSDSGAIGPDSYSDEFVVNRDAALLSEPQTAAEDNVASVNVEPIEANAGSGFVPLDPSVSLIPDPSDSPDAVQQEEVQQEEVQQEEVQQEVEQQEEVQQEKVQQEVVQQEVVQQEVVQQEEEQEVVEQEEAVAVEEPSVAEQTFVPQPEQLAMPEVQAAETESVAESKSPFHEQVASPDDPEIRRQAEEIIRSLGTDLGVTQIQVSNENPSAPLSIQEETNVIEASIQRSIEAQPVPEPSAAAAPSSPVVMPELDKIKNALRQAQDAQNYPSLPVNTEASAPPSGQIPVQIAGVDPVESEQEILNEVREQSALVSGAVVSQETPQPGGTHPVAGQDDREILEVVENQPVGQEVAATETQEAPLPAWSQQEPSQGEAARVDYQRLFDQLRNVQGNQE